MTLFGQILTAIRNCCRGPMTRQEVERALTDLEANTRPSKGLLDWKHSIVDLLKLLDLDSSLPARRELAREFDYHGPLDGSEEMNAWLHERVMLDVASRYVDIPEKQS